MKSEEDVCNVVNAIKHFINPFVVGEPDALYCISSGAPASSDVEHDLLTVDEVGMKAHTAFVNDRLVEQEISFHSSIKRQNLKTFASLVKSTKVTGKSKKTKKITAERNVFGQLVMLALDYDLDMKRVLSYPLGPVPWALAIAKSDGMPVKTEKAKLLHILEGKNQVQRPTTGDIFYVIDGNALLQAMVAIPSTFGDLADSVFEQLPKVHRVDFVTDSYHPLSIKEVERSRRGTSAPHQRLEEVSIEWGE
ncbi:hypothetical protein QZH41_002367 [Actinostola sp. cb2023]|nr:hypothetical protein QZH41_002367 [Actinostola sp. cb2023]